MKQCSTSDFPILLGDNLSPGYSEHTTRHHPPIRLGVISIETCGFQNSVLKYLNTGNLLEKVKEGQKGPEVPVPEEGRYYYAVETYEESMKFSWEMLVNDDLNAFSLSRPLSDRTQRTRGEIRYFSACRCSRAARIILQIRIRTGKPDYQQLQCRRVKGRC